MPSDPLPLPLFEQTSRWFERANAALLDEVPCRQGCHRCCIGVFPVTILDRDVIQQGLRSMTKEQRQAITTVAAQHADLISSAAPRLRSNPFIDEWRDREIDALVEQHRDLPCPALQADGSCGVYPFRPLTCRSMGIPAEEHGVVQGACEVQTFVPLVRVPQALREQEDALAKREAEELAQARRRTQAAGEELLLPYAFRPPS